MGIRRKPPHLLMRGLFALKKYHQGYVITVGYDITLQNYLSHLASKGKINPASSIQPLAPLRAHMPYKEPKKQPAERRRIFRNSHNQVIEGTMKPTTPCIHQKISQGTS